jgi:SAP domain-containing ribonucleoprotein
MTDYAKLKNAELEALLKSRGLPHAGKKAEMVARLQEDDTKKPSGTEDVIDWDDEDVSKAPQASAPAPAEAAPSTDAPAVIPSTSETAAVTEASEPAAESAAPAPVAEAERAKTPVDFSMGIAQSTIDEEIEKRRARAKKFGTELDPLAEEALRNLERAKKFGDAGGPRGLNEALPERQKRSRGDGEERRGDFKRRGGGERGGRFNGNRKRGPPTGSRPQGVEKKPGAQGSWMTDADRIAAEKRKARFA